jgi:hypothetical protein
LIVSTTAADGAQTSQGPRSDAVLTATGHATGHVSPPSGDPDPATRKYISEFLMRAHDRQTVSALWAPMAPLLKDPQPGNQLYNVAVVCGTWARVLPADLDDLRDRVREVLKQLRKRIDKNPTFAHTATLLAEMGARD